MSNFAYLLSGLMLSTSPAAAQTAPVRSAQAEQVPSADSSDVNRIVCRKTEKIGSRLGAKKVCLTVKEWQERTSADREETERMQNNAWVEDSE